MNFDQIKPSIVVKLKSHIELFLFLLLFLLLMFLYLYLKTYLAMSLILILIKFKFLPWKVIINEVNGSSSSKLEVAEVKIMNFTQ